MKPSLKSSLSAADERLGGVGGLSGKYKAVHKNSTAITPNSRKSKIGQSVMGVN